VVAVILICCCCLLLTLLWFYGDTLVEMLGVASQQALTALA